MSTGTVYTVHTVHICTLGLPKVGRYVKFRERESLYSKPETKLKTKKDQNRVPRVLSSSSSRKKVLALLVSKKKPLN